MVPNHFDILDAYFKANKFQYNFIHKADCGIFTHKFLIHLRGITKNLRFVHLRKYSGQTQYENHAIDVILFDNRGLEGGTPMMEVDILGSAESPDAFPTWQDRMTAYTEKDMMQPNEVGNGSPTVPMVPWLGYDEALFNNRLQQQLAYDYGRRPQDADFMVSVWSARVFHSTYMGPEKKPLGFDVALRKHRPEWCEALGVVVDNKWF